jgi:hypothetical protein
VDPGVVERETHDTGHAALRDHEEDQGKRGRERNHDVGRGYEAPGSPER